MHPGGGPSAIGDGAYRVPGMDGESLLLVPQDVYQRHLLGQLQTHQSQIDALQHQLSLSASQSRLQADGERLFEEVCKEKKALLEENHVLTQKVCQESTRQLTMGSNWMARESWYPQQLSARLSWGQHWSICTLDFCPSAPPPPPFNTGYVNYDVWFCTGPERRRGFCEVGSSLTHPPTHAPP